jgi:hypothetical protein
MPGLTELFGGGLFRPPAAGSEADRKKQAIQALIDHASPDVVENWAELGYAEWWWSQQPPALRALREIGDVLERRERAKQLAREGYSVDAAIAVYGYSPLRTQRLRRQLGYTWVPAVGMNPILVAPGISVPGLPPYDPKNPPPGAILVDPNPDSHADPALYLDKFSLAHLVSILAANYGVEV